MNNNHLYTQFISNENKGLVWSLLTENDAFKDIPNHKAPIIKNIFDSNINEIGQKINPSDNLINLNKVIITNMMNEVKNHKSMKMDSIYNASELSQQRQKMFEDELSNKKKEFDKLNNKPVPDNIDFSDNLDSPIGEDMDKILKAQIEIRETQLNNVLNTQNQDEAKKWISTTNIIDNNNNDNDKKIKIGENINLDINDLTKQKKKVIFEDEIKKENENETNDFMSLLKRKKTIPAPAPAPAPAQIHEMLKEILDKQNQILELLNNNNNK